MPINSSEKEMPRYKSHKTVWALKINKIEMTTDGSGDAVLSFEENGYAPIRVDAIYFDKPQPGGYYVVYSDGYKSWSPADVFESGYTKQ